MVEKIEQARLRDGTLVQHKTNGYRGRIEGTTEIKSCFTRGGATLALPTTKEAFQYRVVVAGELMRHIAPAEDLEVLFEEPRVNVTCSNCRSIFRSKPGVVNKAAGRCECGAWICPDCLACQASNEESAPNKHTPCMKQSQRMKRRQAKHKKSTATALRASHKI
jgi:hypothetical protein